MRPYYADLRGFTWRYSFVIHDLIWGCLRSPRAGNPMMRNRVPGPNETRIDLKGKLFPSKNGFLAPGYCRNESLWIHQTQFTQRFTFGTETVDLGCPISTCQERGPPPRHQLKVLPNALDAFQADGQPQSGPQDGHMLRGSSLLNL